MSHPDRISIAAIWWGLGLLGVLAGCVSPSPPTGGRSPTDQALVSPSREQGLRFKLSPANAASDAAGALPQATPTPLSPQELEPLLRRLPPIQSQAGDRQAFALRESSKPRPRTARTLSQPFPPLQNRLGPPPVPQDLPLKVLSVSPKGDVTMAPHLQITFNQPMVPLATLEQLDLRGVPVKLNPSTPGKWRWLGTQTLMFVPDVRFPMATHFQLEIPAGLKSAQGTTLGQAQVYPFDTPPLTLEESSPGGSPQPLTPFLTMRFNQDMDAAQVARKLRLTTSDGPEAPLRLARPEEIAQDDSLAAQAKQAGKRWLALKPTQELLPGHTYTLEIPAGTPSAEGPRLTEKPQTYSFATYDPLKVVWKTDKTPPLQSWHVQFNNPLDARKFDPAWVTVTPALPGLKVRAAGSGLSISGRSKGRTRYQVSIARTLIDQFGQTLTQPERFSVEVGSAEPTFLPPPQQFSLLDPQGPRQLTCQVVNYSKIHVRAWKVGPEDYEAYLRFLQTRGQNLKDQPRTPPGLQAIDRVVETRAKTDEETEVAIDLSQALNGQGLGQVVVSLDPEPQPHREEWRRQIYYGWVQSTRLGLDVASDRQQMLAWVNDLSTGKPLSGVQITTLPQSQSAQSDIEGLARLPLKSSVRLLMAQKGEDRVILPRDFYYWGSSDWNSSSPSDATLWHVLDDRKLYRPGEKVNLKGWVRKQEYGPEGDLVMSPSRSLTYVLRDSQYNEVSKGSARVGRLGGFNLALSLPKTINLGNTVVELSDDLGNSTTHSFQVEEFRRPEFEVSAESRPSTSQIGSSSVLTASAAYFSGGPLANAKVNWSVTATPTSYSPPGWEGYTFGTWVPWWPCRRWWDEEFSGPGPGSPQPQSSQETRTDSKGKSSLKVDFLSVNPPRPHSLSAEATVQDVNRQSWTSSTSVMVHPAEVYVGIKSQRTFVEKGQPLALSLILTDLDGKAIAGKPIQLKAYRLDYDDEGRPLQVDLQEKQVNSAAQPVEAELATKEGGVYQVEALVQDDQNRSNSSQMTVWVAGGKQPPERNVAQESLTLIPSKAEYQAGESAEVLVQAPFAPAELLVTTRRNGLARVERVSAPDGSATLKFALEEKHIPGLSIQVDAVGSKKREREEGQRPAYATGALTLNISSLPRKLTVSVRPDKSKLEPGQSTQLSVELKDHQGQPVQGEVTLVVVDESVLALTGYDPADPLGSFCQLRSTDCEDRHIRQYLVLNRVENPPEEDERRSLPQEESVMDGAVRGNATADSLAGGAIPPPPPMPAAQAAPAAQPSRSEAKNTAYRVRNKTQSLTTAGPQFKVRSNFAALALFAPALATDNQGKARIEVKLPDSLTRYRVIALAAANVKQFGKGESSLVARQPLMLRPSPPRFMNFGDRLELPVVLQNQTDQPMAVALACRASNARVAATRNGTFGQATGYKLEIPANDRLEVRIPCAADQAGTARFQFGATSNSAGDAAEVSLPVWTPATTEAFATYGVLDQGATRQPIQPPTGVWPQFGGLTVTTSSTALAELTDAFIYLVSYPFECSEQVSSRMLAAAALKDVLDAFRAPGAANPEELKQSMARDLQRLRGQQNDDGGWDYWTRGEPSVPYLSVHVTHALVRVRDKGFSVDPGSLEQALDYLASIESHIPADYGPEVRRSIRAYALYVLNLAGRPDLQKARQLVSETSLEKLGLESLGWLLPTLAKDPALTNRIVDHLENHSTQTASTAQFSQSYSDQNYLILYSDRRDDGLLLESLIAVRPQHPLIPKLVRGLLDHRTAGRWANTQETCWVLLALDRYFHQYESVTPNFVASLWLGDRFAGEQAFRGRDKDEKELKVPMAEVKGDLTLAKEGPGRLYYRIGLNYAPKDLKQPALDAGFSVSRSYEATGDNRDVSRGPDGVWHIKAGSEVRVTVTMQAPSRRYHVALVDPLPAGLEALNPGLLGSGSRAQAPQNRWDGWWSQYWFNHQNMRDERVEAFTQLLWEGVYTYSYVARATTLGNFVVPPAKAEEMYHPETFGRSASDRVVVE